MVGGIFHHHNPFTPSGLRMNAISGLQSDHPFGVETYQFDFPLRLKYLGITSRVNLVHHFVYGIEDGFGIWLAPIIAIRAIRGTMLFAR